MKLFILGILLMIPYLSISQDSSIQIVSYDKIDTFYVYPEDNSGLVVWGAQEWVLEGNGAISSTDGEQNTSDIVAEFGSNCAAYICDTLTAYGYDDWYLPSLDEMGRIFELRGDTLGILPTEWYWTSTEYSEIFVRAFRAVPWMVGFRDKTLTGIVRCIRK